MSETDMPATETDVPPGLAEAVRFQRDLYLYWRTARALDGLPLTGRRFVTRPALRRVRGALALDPGTPPADDERAEGEDARLFFLRRLLERLGLLTLASDADRLLPGPDEEMERYLALPLATRIRSDVRLWVAGGWWPDRPDPRAEPPRSRVPAPPKLALARRRLVEALAALDSGAPIALPAEPAPGSRWFPRRTVPRLRILPTRSGAPADAAPSLASLPPDDLPTACAALDGPLRWLGLVAADNEESPDAATGTREALRAGVALAAVRAHDQQDATDATLDTPTDQPGNALPEVAGRVVIQPDLSVLAFPPLTAPALHFLDRVAEEVALDTTARYRLSEPALAQALRRGWDVPRVLAELTTLTGMSLPDNVRVLLGDWARRSERIRLQPEATLLEVARPNILAALLREPGARRWIERQLTPTAALLRPESVGAVRAWLLRHGEFPALTSDVSPAPAHSDEPMS